LNKRVNHGVPKGSLVFSKRPKEILAFTVNLGSSFVRDPDGANGWLGHRAVYLCVVLTCGGA
ncbi:MAG TPA: hypothetical protein VIH58_04870, partial [Chthoniobacterales bacterium]